MKTLSERTIMGESCDRGETGLARPPREGDGVMLTIEYIKKAVAPICERYGVNRLTLFGSYARNEADEESDVDLLVDRGSLTGFAYGGFYGDIQRALGTKTDMLTTSGARSKFLDAIKKDEVLLYEK